MDYILTTHQAELNAASKMRSWGFVDATSTTGGSDGGIDVRSRQVLAQVVGPGGVAGRPDMQRLYGARGTDTGKKLSFFSASGYSRQAVDYGNQVGIGLYTYDPTGEVQPVNGAAARTMGAANKTRMSPCRSARISGCSWRGWPRWWWPLCSRRCRFRSNGTVMVDAAST